MKLIYSYLRSCNISHNTISLASECRATLSANSIIGASNRIGTTVREYLLWHGMDASRAMMHHFHQVSGGVSWCQHTQDTIQDCLGLLVVSSTNRSGKDDRENKPEIGTAARLHSWSNAAYKIPTGPWSLIVSLPPWKRMPQSTLQNPFP